MIYMRHFISATCMALLLCLNIHAQKKGQQKSSPQKAVLSILPFVDWIKNPFYPVPYVATANHMKLRGPVKTMKETTIKTNSRDVVETTFAFKQNGILQQNTYSLNGKLIRETTRQDTQYVYLPDQLRIYEKSSWNGKVDETTITYVKNQLFTIESSGGSKRKFYHTPDNQIRTVLRNGHIIDTLGYTYNSKGQLVRFIEIDKGLPLQQSDYRYQFEKDHWVVTEEYFNIKTTIKVHTFDAQGNLLKTVVDANGKKTEYLYTFDQQGNWIIQDETVTENGSVTKIQRYRKYTYYE